MTHGCLGPIPPGLYKRSNSIIQEWLWAGQGTLGRRRHRAGSGRERTREKGREREVEERKGREPTCKASTTPKIWELSSAPRSTVPRSVAPRWLPRRKPHQCHPPTNAPDYLAPRHVSTTPIIMVPRSGSIFWKILPGAYLWKTFKKGPKKQKNSVWSLRKLETPNLVELLAETLMNGTEYI
jgi:hypothetical protein